MAMFNQKNKVMRADYEQWRAGQDETAARIASDPDRLLFHVEPETPTVWFRLVIRITSIINTIRSMLRMAVQCFGTI